MTVMACAQPHPEDSKGRPNTVDGAEPGSSAVVRVAVEWILAAPSDGAAVTSQVTLGATLTVLESTPPSKDGFVKVRTPEGYTGWIPASSLVAWPKDKSPYAAGRASVVTRSPRANLYRTPSFTRGKPLMTVPAGTSLESMPVGLSDRARYLTEDFPDFSRFVEVLLPDGGPAFLPTDNVETLRTDPNPSPARWIAFGKRVLGTPYTWGGTTPEGFDCSGLTQFLLRQDGIVVKRDSYEQCFQEPKLVAVPIQDPKQGDFLFFGSEDRIDHVALYIGDGEVIEATRVGEPMTKISKLDSPALAPRLRCARRLSELAPPVKPRTPEQLRALEVEFLKLAHEAFPGDAASRVGIHFSEVKGGSAQHEGKLVLYAASAMKTAILLEVLRRVDAEALRWDDPIDIRNQFASVVDGARFSIEVDVEQEERVKPLIDVKSGSGETTVGFLATEMMVRSSNLATNRLLALVGPESVTALCQAIGAVHTKIVRPIEDAKAAANGLENTTDAEGLARILLACQEDIPGLALSPRSRARALDILRAQHFNDGIPAGLHPQSGAVVGHKSGLTSQVKHDSGLVWLPDGRAYALVILTAGHKGPADLEKAKLLIQRVSRAAWDAMVAP